MNIKELAKLCHESVIAAYKLGSQDARREERERCAEIAKQVTEHAHEAGIGPLYCAGVHAASAHIEAKIRSGE